MPARPRRIVVGFDGSEPARRALDAAAQLTGYGSMLTVVHVVLTGAGADDTLAQAREHLLRELVAASYVQRIGEAANEIVEAACELEADLVVVGRRGEGVLAGPAPGSVSVKVVDRAPCDVLVVS